MIFSTMILLGATLTVPAEEVTFAGLWERDAERSDDPQEKMQAAMEQMREQMGRRGGGGGGRPPGGGGGGFGGGRGNRGGGREGGGGRPDLGNIPDELSVEMDGEEFQVDDGERLHIYYLDGVKHKRETANGTKLETTSELKGNAVVIEEKMERGQIDRKFELSPDGATMIMTLTVKLGRMKDPVVIRTVYTKGEGAGDAN